MTGKRYQGRERFARAVGRVLDLVRAHEPPRDERAHLDRRRLGGSLALRLRLPPHGGQRRALAPLGPHPRPSSSAGREAGWWSSTCCSASTRSRTATTSRGTGMPGIPGATDPLPGPHAGRRGGLGRACAARSRPTAPCQAPTRRCSLRPWPRCRGTRRWPSASWRAASSAADAAEGRRAAPALLLARGEPAYGRFAARSHAALRGRGRRAGARAARSGRGRRLLPRALRRRPAAPGAPRGPLLGRLPGLLPPPPARARRRAGTREARRAPDAVR